MNIRYSIQGQQNVTAHVYTVIMAKRNKTLEVD